MEIRLYVNLKIFRNIFIAFLPGSIFPENLKKMFPFASKKEKSWLLPILPKVTFTSVYHTVYTG